MILGTGFDADCCVTQYLAEDRGPTIIIINCLITGIAAIVVIARLASRFAILRKLGLDDWSIPVATALAVGNVVVASQSKLKPSPAMSNRGQELRPY